MKLLPANRVEFPGFIVETLSRRPQGVSIYSPSQAKTFQSCERLWGFQKIDGIKTPSSPAQALGTAMHDVAEKWLSEGIIPDENRVVMVPHGPRYPGRIFKPGIKYLPPPRTALVEQEFYLRVLFYYEERWWVVHFTGFVDCLDVEGKRVIDHKTTSAFRWALTSTDLAQDFQAIIYAVAALVAFGWTSVSARWVYYLTNGRAQAKPSEHFFTRTEAFSSFAAPLLYALEMESAKASGKHGGGLRPNYGACGNYGGCYFRSKCNILDRGKQTAEERIEALMSENKSQFNLKTFLSDQLGSASQQASPPPLPPPPSAQLPGGGVPPLPPPPATPEVPEVSSAPVGEPGEPGAAPPPPPVPVVETAPTSEPTDRPPVTTSAPPPVPEPPVPVVGTGGPESMDRAALKAELLAAGLIEPSCRFGQPRLLEMVKEHRASLGTPPTQEVGPDGKPLMSGAELLQAVAQTKTNPESPFYQEGAVAPPPPPPSREVAPLPPPPTHDHVDSPPHMVDGRNAMATEPPPSPATATAEQPPEAMRRELLPPTPPPPPVPEPATGQQSDLEFDRPRFNVLFVDCMPVVGNDDKCVMFSKFLQPLMDDISPDIHYRLHPDAGFGKASALICQRVEEELRNVDPKASFIVSARIAEHRDCMQVLEAAARLVVRSF